MIASSAVKAACTQAFLDAFSSLGIEPWAGIEIFFFLLHSRTSDQALSVIEVKYARRI